MSSVHKHQRRRTKKSYIKTRFVTFRSHLIWDFCARKFIWSQEETEKVAFSKSRRLVMVRSLLHLLPVAIAVILIYFNIWQYYVGGELAGPTGQDSQKLGALQFAGKLHELMMLATISAIVFSYIRAQLTFGEGVSIGTLLAGHQFSTISNLWSMEFWCAVYSAKVQKKGGRRQKWWLIVVITVATLLGVSVGPSSNNLMRPRLDWWKAGGTEFWLDATQAALFPLNYSTDGIPASCSQFDNDTACPYGDFDSLINQRIAFWPKMTWLGSMPEKALSKGQMSLREVMNYYRSPRLSPGALISGHYETSVRAPKAGIADALTELIRLWALAAANRDHGKRFRYRVDASFEAEALLPEVQAYCLLHNETGATPDKEFMLVFTNITNGTNNGAVPYTQVMTAPASNDSNLWLRNALFNPNITDAGAIL
ncbi:hypothetical protein TI39_contig452g00016 [Zymoseptoria brevis]|uniref:Uncharacterized protein n=1 Tax=Zymoseptoria brevis TaxID=1047168 RepID=A0A0F4GKN2_9PEZI|nr:hypothetical protein TI39_contig452g00016 [Zymoseptoria brevis]